MRDAAVADRRFAPRRVGPTVNFRQLSTWGFPLIHAGCGLVLWVGASRPAVLALAVTYLVRAFAITGGFHRYFSHRSFKTSRTFQFILAWLGTAAMQRGPLWWAAQHRHHHRFSDTEWDVHSPVTASIFWAHMGWIVCRREDAPDLSLVPDFARYPELRWLDRHFLVPPAALVAVLAGLGLVLPHTSPLQIVVWGFGLSTVALYHAVFSVNSIAHRFGTRRFATRDNSRNNVLVAVAMLGEGFHNNHHRFPSLARFGQAPLEIDMGYLLLRLLARLGIVWDLRDGSQGRGLTHPRVTHRGEGGVLAKKTQF